METTYSIFQYLQIPLKFLPLCKNSQTILSGTYKSFICCVNNNRGNRNRLWKLTLRLRGRQGRCATGSYPSLAQVTSLSAFARMGHLPQVFSFQALHRGLEQQRAQEGERRWVPGHHLRQGRGGLRPLHPHQHLRVRGLQNCPENHWLTRHSLIDSIQYSYINNK